MSNKLIPLEYPFLIDLDGVIFDLMGAVRTAMLEIFPSLQIAPASEWREYIIRYNFPSEYSDYVREIMSRPGFFASLPIIEGSLDALEELAMNGVNAMICTKPSGGSPVCAHDKLIAIQTLLPSYFRDKYKITRDKTTVPGCYLLDDAPRVMGIQEPEWEQIIYTHRYNDWIPNVRRLTWSNWREVLGPLIYRK
jgi:5'-nucleotidase